MTLIVTTSLEFCSSLVWMASAVLHPLSASGVDIAYVANIVGVACVAGNVAD